MAKIQRVSHKEFMRQFLKDETSVFSLLSEESYYRENKIRCYLHPNKLAGFAIFDKTILRILNLPQNTAVTMKQLITQAVKVGGTNAIVKEEDLHLYLSVGFSIIGEYEAIPGYKAFVLEYTKPKRKVTERIDNRLAIVSNCVCGNTPMKTLLDNNTVHCACGKCKREWGVV